MIYILGPQIVAIVKTFPNIVLHYFKRAFSKKYILLTLLELFINGSILEKQVLVLACLHSFKKKGFELSNETYIIT